MMIFLGKTVVISKVSVLEGKHIISEKYFMYFQQLEFFKMQHGHLGLHFSLVVLCHQTWDPSHED